MPGLSFGLGFNINNTLPDDTLQDSNGVVLFDSNGVILQGA